MMVCEKNKLSENKLPRLRQQCWDEIAIQYNDGQGTNFTRAQVISRYKNYQSELKSQMKTQDEEKSVNVKTEISDDTMDIKNEDISTAKVDVLCDFEAAEPEYYMSNGQKIKKRTKFNDDALMLICEENKLSEKKNPQIRQQCWIDITKQYNEQQGTDFTKIKVIQRYKNYRWSLKSESHNITPVECKVCQKVFAGGSQALWRHMKRDHKDSEVSCDLCGKVFLHVDNLNSHKKRIHEALDKREEHICDLCGKIFVQRKSLKLHIDCFHHNKRDYSCHICGRAFFGTTDVKRHIECIHEGRKDHHCHLCGRQFGIFSALKRHIEVHEGIKRYKCHFCEQLYGSHSGRKKHMRRMHPTLFVERISRGQGSKTFVPIDQSQKNLSEAADP